MKITSAFSLLALFLLTVLTLTACTSFEFPGVHRINIQQGNIVSPQMINKLKPGMSKNQVLFVLGRPIVQNPMRDNRWDYIHTFQIANGLPIKSELKLYFTNDHLDYFEGDYLPTSEYKRKLEELKVEQGIVEPAAETGSEGV